VSKNGAAIGIIFFISFIFSFSLPNFLTADNNRKIQITTRRTYCLAKQKIKKIHAAAIGDGALLK
jgi:hypothetical protein